MTNRTLSQTEWTYVSTVLITPEMQGSRQSSKNFMAHHTGASDLNSTVRYVVASSSLKQLPYLRIVGLKAGMLLTLIESWNLNGEL